MKKYTILYMMFLLAGINGIAQNAEKAKQYFGKATSKTAMLALIKNSLPTPEECKLVFKEGNAATYYEMVEKVKAQLETEQVNQDEKFQDIRVNSFTTEDIISGKGNYVGGMSRIADRLMPAITFYSIVQLNQVNAESGIDYNYWVYLNNRWVFFPKPHSAFKSK